MIARTAAISIVFILLIGVLPLAAYCQPSLPDIAASADKGIAVLSWNCQYSGIKSITVMRSTDSINNYSQTGTVKELEKGLQAFVDGHPKPGKNYYRLAILFKSGLKWTSNTVSVVMTGINVQESASLPSNDSLQHFTVTEENAAAPMGKTKTASGNNSIAGGNQTVKHKVSISFDQDITQPDLQTYPKEQEATAQPKRKITLSFDDPAASPSIAIQSRFVFTDPATGNVNMVLPDDVGHHHYSIKFYDQQNHMVIEVPKIKNASIIFDRRNFQHKGIYKFTIRKDVIELETGYVTIKNF